MPEVRQIGTGRDLLEQVVRRDGSGFRVLGLEESRAVTEQGEALHVVPGFIKPGTGKCAGGVRRVVLRVSPAPVNKGQQKADYRQPIHRVGSSYVTYALGVRQCIKRSETGNGSIVSQARYPRVC